MAFSGSLGSVRCAYLEQYRRTYTARQEDHTLVAYLSLVRHITLVDRLSYPTLKLRLQLRSAILQLC
jgi:hypothetical protein